MLKASSLHVRGAGKVLVQSGTEDMDGRKLSNAQRSRLSLCLDKDGGTRDLGREGDAGLSRGSVCSHQ